MSGRLLFLAPAILLVASQSLPAKKRRDIPGLKKWEHNMTFLGHRWCNLSKTYGFGWEADVWYYDGTRVYYQIADYTHDPSWNKCALHIAEQYRAYVLQNSGKLRDGECSPRDASRLGNAPATIATNRP